MKTIDRYSGIIEIQFQYFIYQNILNCKKDDRKWDENL